MVAATALAVVVLLLAVITAVAAAAIVDHKLACKIGAAAFVVVADD